MNCSECKNFKIAQNYIDQLTREIIEDENLLENLNWIGRLLFRDSILTDIDNKKRWLDLANEYGYCTLNPQAVEVHVNHYCSFFTNKWGKENG